MLTPLGNATLVRSAGLRRVEELDWWEQATSSSVPITLTPAQHFSARTPFDRNRALWGGFLVAAPSVRIFFAGDTAYGDLFHDFVGASGQLTWRCSRLARTSHGGSCVPFT